jgi:hypothetical protein
VARRNLLLALLLLILCPTFIHAQKENTFYVKGFAGPSASTVGAMTSAAQESCDANTSIPCVIVFDPTLAIYPSGNMPSKCAQCIWQDFRTAVVPGGGTGDVVGPASSTSGNLPSFNGTGGKTLQDSGVAAATVTKTIASGQTAMRTVAIASATCDTVLTIAATGTAATDVITVGFSGDATAITGYTPAVAGAVTVYAYPTANNVNFKVCNSTASSITPGAIAFNWRVVR